MFMSSFTCNSRPYVLYQPELVQTLYMHLGKTELRQFMIRGVETQCFYRVTHCHGLMPRIAHATLYLLILPELDEVQPCCLQLLVLRTQQSHQVEAH
jgi:hypothetical protein